MTSNNRCTSPTCAEERKENVRLRALLTERGIELPTPAESFDRGAERARARYGTRNTDAGWSGKHVTYNN